MPETVSTKKSPAVLKKKKVSVTEIKRKKVIRNIVEKNGKSLSVSAAMRDAGYSPGYAKNPQNFINTKPAQDLLEQFFPDEFIYSKTKELIGSSKLDSYTFPAIGKGKNGKPQMLTNEEIRFIIEEVGGCTLLYIRDNSIRERIAFFKQTDARALKDGIDIAAKLKGAYKTDAVNPNDLNPFKKMSDEELQAAITEAKKVLRKK